MSNIKKCRTIYTILIVLNAATCFIDLPLVSESIRAIYGIKLHILPTIINSFLFLTLNSATSIFLKRKASETILKTIYIGVSFLIYIIPVIFLFAGAYMIGGEYGALTLFLLTLLLSHSIIFYAIHAKKERKAFLLSSVSIIIIYFTLYISIPANAKYGFGDYLPFLLDLILLINSIGALVMLRKKVV